jgi:hypothetical protein
LPSAFFACLHKSHQVNSQTLHFLPDIAQILCTQQWWEYEILLTVYKLLQIEWRSLMAQKLFYIFLLT